MEQTRLVLIVPWEVMVEEEVVVVEVIETGIGLLLA